MTDHEAKLLREELNAAYIKALAGQSRLRQLQKTASPAELKRLRDTEPNYTKELELIEARLAALDGEQA
jgi:hypothetical protein